MFTGIRLKEKVKPTAKLIKGLSHKHKIAIIYLLSWGPLETREIVADVDLPQNLVEHHLKNMYESGWVTKHRIGRSVTYALNEKAFFDLIKLIKDTPLANRLLLKKLYQ